VAVKARKYCRKIVVKWRVKSRFSRAFFCRYGEKCAKEMRRGMQGVFTCLRKILETGTAGGYNYNIVNG
jgi:hypothetical protein